MKLFFLLVLPLSIGLCAQAKDKNTTMKFETCGWEPTFGMDGIVNSEPPVYLNKDAKVAVPNGARDTVKRNVRKGNDHMVTVERPSPTGGPKERHDLTVSYNASELPHTEVRNQNICTYRRT